jgi:arsenate reductase
MKKILVLCSGNSSRSQMAEGYLNYYAQGRANFCSAGLDDRGINPLAIEVMEEDNIDISENTSKSYKEFEGIKFDYLITLCDEAHTHRPKRLNARHYIHFSVPDPGQFEGDREEQLEGFRRIRETVKKHILKFIGKELSDQLELAVA